MNILNKIFNGVKQAGLQREYAITKAHLEVLQIRELPNIRYHLENYGKGMELRPLFFYEEKLKYLTDLEMHLKGYLDELSARMGK